MRRDYAAAFDALSHPAVLAQLRRHNESLLLLGHVSTLRPTAIVPPHLEPYVRTLSGLPYMVSCMLLFAIAALVCNKACSSEPCAIFSTCCALLAHDYELGVKLGSPSRLPCFACTLARFLCTGFLCTGAVVCQCRLPCSSSHA